MFSLSIIIGKGQYWVKKKKRWFEQIVQMLKSESKLSFLSASGFDLAGTGVRELPGTVPATDTETSQATTEID